MHCNDPLRFYGVRWSRAPLRLRLGRRPVARSLARSRRRSAAQRPPHQLVGDQTHNRKMRVSAKSSGFQPIVRGHKREPVSLSLSERLKCHAWNGLKIIIASALASPFLFGFRSLRPLHLSLLPLHHHTTSWTSPPGLDPSASGWSGRELAHLLKSFKGRLCLGRRSKVCPW